VIDKYNSKATHNSIKENLTEESMRHSNSRFPRHFYKCKSFLRQFTLTIWHLLHKVKTKQGILAPLIAHRCHHHRV